MPLRIINLPPVPGQTLYARPGDVTDIDMGQRRTFQWYKNGELLSGKTEQWYTVQPGDLLSEIVVVMTYTSTKAENGERTTAYAGVDVPHPLTPVLEEVYKFVLGRKLRSPGEKFYTEAYDNGTPLWKIVRDIETSEEALRDDPDNPLD